jgi:adenine-specific DNA-methyltransferase
MEAADRVDSTTGVQMAYLKQWAERAYNELELRVPELFPRSRYGKSRAYQLDAIKAIQRLEGDLIYLDPPYNQHKYLGNYHIWESVVLWDKPEVYGVACKRIDCKTRKSDFNSRTKCQQALEHVLQHARCKYLLVSFNNEGYVSREQMEKLLGQRGRVRVVTTPYKRYVGAQIGIYNPSGKRVVKVSHLHNKEYLYLVSVG